MIQQKNESGFTLIEVLVAMAILAVGLLGTAMMQAHFATGNAQSRQIIHASDILTNKIEELANITESTHADLQQSNNPHTETITDYRRDYTVTWNVTDNVDETLSLDLSVTWSTGGRSHDVSVHWIKAL